MELAQKFFDIFKGMQSAYGTYTINKSEGEKQTGQAVTYREKVTLELWENHLLGKTGLGIVPINEESKCYFGAIDIDEYPIDYMKVIGKIRELDLPLIPCKSKSGGLHLYLFLSEAIEAALLSVKLKEFAIKLGYGTSQLFPTQTVVLVERGDVGNWINMPYFNYQDTTRYAYFPDGTIMDVQDFLTQVQKVQITNKTLLDKKVDLINELVDGPPCLQYLIKDKFPGGHRNLGLFSLGVYLKKSDPDNLVTRLYEFNNTAFGIPLDAGEINSVLRSLDKKDYQYTCNKPPLKPHCNSELCRTKKYGISNLYTGNFKLENLTKYNSDPPIWFVNLAGTNIRLELTTEDLQNQVKFHKRCLEAANIYPPAMNKNAWLLMMQELLKTMVTIEAPKGTTFKGQFVELLEKFCTSKAQAKTKNDLLLGKPWNENGFYYFRLSDLVAYLERQHFKELKTNQIASALRDIGGESNKMRLLNKIIDCWSVPEFQKIEGIFKVEGIAETDTI